MLTKKKSMFVAVLMAAPLLFGALTACSSVETGSGADRTPSSGSDTKTFDTFEEYRLAFSQCMRDKGIDMEDPTSGGQDITQNDDAFAEAAETCQSEIGEPPARDDESGSGDSDAIRQEYLKIAECLRERGIDVPDPAPGEIIEIPSDVPVDAFETCAPNGVVGPVTGGN